MQRWLMLLAPHNFINFTGVQIPCVRACTYYFFFIFGKAWVVGISGSTQSSWRDRSAYGLFILVVSLLSFNFNRPNSLTYINLYSRRFSPLKSAQSIYNRISSNGNRHCYQLPLVQKKYFLYKKKVNDRLAQMVWQHSLVFKSDFLYRKFHAGVKKTSSFVKLQITVNGYDTFVYG